MRFVITNEPIGLMKYWSIFLGILVITPCIFDMDERPDSAAVCSS